MTTHALLKRILKAPEFIRDHEWGAAVHRSLELMFSGELAKSSVIAQYAVCAFWRYGMPTLITCSQYPEKLILFVPDPPGTTGGMRWTVAGWQGC